MPPLFVHCFALPGVRILTAHADAGLATQTPYWVNNVVLCPNTKTGNTDCKVYYYPTSTVCTDLEAVELIISVWFTGLLTDDDFYARYPEFKRALDTVEADRLLAEAQAEHAFLKAIEERCKALYLKRASYGSA